MKFNKYFFIIILSCIITVFAGFYEFESNIDSNIKTLALQKPNKIYQAIQQKKQYNNFDYYEPFKLSATTISDLNQYVNLYTILEINKSEYWRLINQKPQLLVIKIPANDNKLFTAEMERVEIIPDNFTFKQLSTNQSTIVTDKKGIYYQGIINGDPNSLAAISFFKDEVIGVFSDQNGNYVLGNMKDAQKSKSDKCIFYNDRDLKIKNEFKCLVDDSNESKLNKGLTRDFTQIKNILKTKPYYDNPTQDSVRIFFVTDYDMYERFNSVSELQNFVSGMFNVVSLIYRNESIPIALAGSFGYYSQPDPYYYMTSSVDVLYAFGNDLRDNFNGDLAHLLSTRNENMGGIAWINVLCQSFNPNDTSGRFAFSNIDDNYLQLPMYSWTVFVVAHEMGHNFASRHTHACVWPIGYGYYGAIDSCYYAEGNCFYYTQPNNNGTVMSYCHLNGYVNLAAGFGPLPGDTIREGYRLALCIDNPLNSSELPVAYDLMQNYPNPFNPGTYINFALPQDANVTISVYDINGRLVAALTDNQFYKASYQSVYFDASRYNIASGVYFYRLEAFSANSKSFSQVKKMTFIK